MHYFILYKSMQKGCREQIRHPFCYYFMNIRNDTLYIIIRLCVYPETGLQLLLHSICLR